MPSPRLRSVGRMAASDDSGVHRTPSHGSCAGDRLALLVFPDVIAMFSTGGMLVGLVSILAPYYAIGWWTNCP
jgi:hypothetical protein